MSQVKDHGPGSSTPPHKDEGFGEIPPWITTMLGLPRLVGVGLTFSDQEVGSRLTRSLGKDGIG